MAIEFDRPVLWPTPEGTVGSAVTTRTALQVVRLLHSEVDAGAVVELLDPLSDADLAAVQLTGAMIAVLTSHVREARATVGRRRA